MQHVVAPLQPVARDHVADRERLGVAHVQVAGGVREHVEHVAAGPLVVGSSLARNGSSRSQTGSHFSCSPPPRPRPRLRRHHRPGGRGRPPRCAGRVLSTPRPTWKRPPPQGGTPPRDDSSRRGPTKKRRLPPRSRCRPRRRGGDPPTERPPLPPRPPGPRRRAPEPRPAEPPPAYRPVPRPVQGSSPVYFLG